MGRLKALLSRIAVEFGVSCIALGAAAFGCTTTLDPSVIVSPEGAAGAGEQPLATCELFTSQASEYMLCAERVDHESAASDCARRDSILAVFESSEENDFVASSSQGVAAGDWWLGGTRNQAFTWSWPSGAVFWRGGPDGAAEDGAFTNWKAGEPNNASTTSPSDEGCLTLTPSNEWNDRACELTLPYICEHPP